MELNGMLCGLERQLWARKLTKKEEHCLGVAVGTHISDMWQLRAEGFCDDVAYVTTSKPQTISGKEAIINPPLQQGERRLTGDP